MAPATCNQEPRPPKPDPSRKWIALGVEASGTVAAFAFLGWWLDSLFTSPMILVACCLFGVGVVFWRLLQAGLHP